MRRRTQCPRTDPARETASGRIVGAEVPGGGRLRPGFDWGGRKIDHHDGGAGLSSEGGSTMMPPGLT